VVQFSGTIAPGFYYIKASTNGTSLLDIAKYPAQYPKLTDEQVRSMAATINPLTGEIDDAYVDTGILNGQGTTAGFGGGTVK